MPSFRRHLLSHLSLRGAQVHASLVGGSKICAFGLISKFGTGSPQCPNLPMQVDLLDKYRALVTLGEISYDEQQVRVIMKLRRLQKDLIDYAPPALPASLLSNPRSPKIFDGPWWSSEDESNLGKAGRSLVIVRGRAEELEALDTPKGLLLTGPPGSGKSFLVDLWFQSMPTPYKARKHYNQLVLEIYRGVWDETQRRMNRIYATSKDNSAERGTWNQSIRQHIRELLKTGSLPLQWKPTYRHLSSGSDDPSIAFVVAKRLLLRHWLLVFDEVQLLDVSSANLLADVLSWYWRMGGVIVGTSNKVPDELYRNGVQRERLEPFVQALKARCPVMILDAEKDWREVEGASQPLERTWFTFDQRDKFHDALAQFTSVAEPDDGRRELRVFGRTIHIPWSSAMLCKFSFSELCDQSLGPADYLTIVSHFAVIAITDIPVLPLSRKDQARRFISLIDALYESRCRIICLAESTADGLFFPDALSSNEIHVDTIMAESVSETEELYRPNVSSYDTPRMREAPAAPKIPLSIDTLSIFSGMVMPYFMS